MSVNISIICYKSKTLSNGEHPLMLRITKDRKRSMKSLGFSVNPVYWDFNKEKPKSNCPNRDLILQIILKTKVEYQKKLMEKTANEEEFTSESLIKESPKEIQAKTVEDFYQALIIELRSNGHTGNSYAYLNSFNSLKSFNKDKKLTFTFSTININFLNKYEDWLRQKNNKDTTISYLFRTLRAAFNKAIEMNIVSKEKNPFMDFKISKFSTKTIKRALSKTDILKIINLETTKTSKIKDLAHDIFVFSYLCGGISFVDIANLTIENLEDRRLIYKRQKTNGAINLYLSEQANSIISKYEAHRVKASYLFPILNRNLHITQMQKRNRVHKICYQVNKELHSIAKEVGLTLDLTTYVARHTFATVLKKSGVNISLISEALGHSDLATTQIYLDSFENSQIDEAMKNLL